MVSLTLEKEELSKTHFVNLKELFDYAVDNQLIWDLWLVNELELNEESRKFYKESFNISDVINI